MSARSLLGLIEHQPTDQRIAALKRVISQSTVTAALEQSGRAGRHCPRLPLWLTVWLVIGMGLFGADGLRAVFKRLQPYRPGATPGGNTIAQSRLALGLLVFRLLARMVVGLLCDEDTPGAFYQGMRLMAVDGFVLDLPDTPDNARVFGKPQSGRAEGAFPQARVLGLCEGGTHVLYRWLVKPMRRGEVSMAATLLRWLEPAREAEGWWAEEESAAQAPSASRNSFGPHLLQPPHPRNGELAAPPVKEVGLSAKDRGDAEAPL